MCIRDSDNGTRHPNLALMKISGYQKELGNDVTLLEDYYSIPKYDEVYLSRVFDFTNVPIDPKNYPNLHIGGTGFFWMTAPDLPLEVEHHMPDYHLYDEYVGRQIARGIKPQTYSCLLYTSCDPTGSWRKEHKEESPGCAGGFLFI